MLAMIPMKANCQTSGEVIKASPPTKYLALGPVWANKNIAGKVKMNPVEACVAPVVAEVAMLTSLGVHRNAIPNR